ncbi:hypothetical protein PMAYCL1PPCAC_25604, partial [Pristionchus mayeri]
SLSSPIFRMTLLMSLGAEKTPKSTIDRIIYQKIPCDKIIVRQNRVITIEVQPLRETQVSAIHCENPQFRIRITYPGSVVIDSTLQREICETSWKPG